MLTSIKRGLEVIIWSWSISRVFRPHKKGARKEGIMLSEASISLYFECPKKGAEKGQNGGFITMSYDI